jgi:glucosamine-6-phosphate deaminase
MEVVITDTVGDASRHAADIIERLMATTPAPVLGLATGSTPKPVYRELIRRHRDQDLSFAGGRVFLLDEYVGLPHDHPETYRRVIEREFTGQIDLPENRIHSPDGAADDLVAAAREYERSMAEAGGVDVQILGIGSDGHIGFNEPSSSLGSRTRLKTLTANTRRDNARFFDGDLDQVPRHCITQGIATILEARHLVLLAFGAEKAGPLADAVEGPVTSMVPASALQFHPHVTVLVDEAAGSLLDHAGYYRQALDNKPEWQEF